MHSIGDLVEVRPDPTIRIGRKLPSRFLGYIIALEYPDEPFMWLIGGHPYDDPRRSAYIYATYELDYPLVELL